MRVSEEQPEFVGYCRHCQATMVMIDGEIRTMHECTNDGHQAERRKDFVRGKPGGAIYRKKE